MSARIVEARSNLLKDNDLIAQALRARFKAAGVVVMNLVSAPGTGKTALLEATLTRMRGRYRAAALTGDPATDNDARRLQRSGAPVRQISTGAACHLDAQMIDTALEGWPIESLDFLFIENVGNLVSPANYDLGESLRVVLLSVTEGEDKPLKYPAIFHSADVAVITKCDLARAVGFDRNAAYANILSVRPGIEILETSTRTSGGLDSWFARFKRLRDPRLTTAAATSGVVVGDKPEVRRPRAALNPETVVERPVQADQ